VGGGTFSVRILSNEGKGGTAEEGVIGRVKKKEGGEMGERSRYVTKKDHFVGDISGKSTTGRSMRTSERRRTEKRAPEGMVQSKGGQGGGGFGGCI